MRLKKLKRKPVFFSFLVLILNLILFHSCQITTEKKSTQHKIISNQDHHTFHLFFTHNLNAEIFPCGCRNHPLGGLHHMHEIIKQHSPSMLIDTGDMLFAGLKVIDIDKEVESYKAKEILNFYKSMGLDLFVPGDQDYAQGSTFLIEELSKRKIPVLLSYERKPMFNHELKSYQLSFKGKNIFFYGIDNKKYLNDFITYFNSQVHQATDTIIILSHLGMEEDQELAKKLSPDWIIGAHTQNFTQTPVKIEKTNIVQVLSQNHYLGHISFTDKNSHSSSSQDQKKLESSFELITVDENNSKIKKDAAINKKMELIQTTINDLSKKREELMMKNLETDQSQSREDILKQKTYLNCSSCHDKQTKFWQSTSHSKAFGTLINANASHRVECISCHALEYDKNKPLTQLTDHFDQYVKALKSKNLSTKNKKAWHRYKDNFIKESKTTFDRTSVQCLHCHEPMGDHPFDVEIQYKTQPLDCQTCHTVDQSPEWYLDKKGSKLNNKVFQQRLKQIRCPQS